MYSVLYHNVLEASVYPTREKMKLRWLKCCDIPTSLYALWINWHNSHTVTQFHRTFFLIFSRPPENLRNCLVEPPESDESDSALTNTLVVTDSAIPVSSNSHGPLPDVSMLASSSQPPSACIDRILESIHVTDSFPVQPYRPSSARSPVMGAHLPNLSRQIPIGEFLPICEECLFTF